MDPMNLQAAVTIIEQSIVSATPADCPLLVGELEKLKAQAWAKMMNGHGHATTSPSDADRLLTPTHVAERLSAKESFVYELCRSGRLGSVKMGKYTRIPEKALVEYQATLKD